MSKYNYLNLNQKMIKIRKKIPVLMRKRYSEEVGYDFVKLDDINQFLTPALNRYGVDFDIVREIPTQTTPAGTKVFLVQEGTMWRYEADLEICWTNADRPEEKITSVLHLVGTNDVADKAKGAAMTYGLKYYLLNKFNIPQNGDEDPDMKTKKPLQEVQKKTVSEKKQETGKTVTDNGKEPKEFATDKDLEEGLKKEMDVSKVPQKEERAIRNGNAVTNMESQQTSFVTEEESMLDQEKAEIAAPTDEPVKEFFDSSEDTVDFLEEERSDESLDEETDADFRTVTDQDEVPFSDEEDDDLPEAAFAEDVVESQEDKIEEAKAVICNFGLYKGKSLGEMLETPKGWESLKWLVTRYRGNNQEMVEAARILVDANAYHPAA